MKKIYTAIGLLILVLFAMIFYTFRWNRECEARGGYLVTSYTCWDDKNKTFIKF